MNDRFEVKFETRRTNAKVSGSSAHRTIAAVLAIASMSLAYPCPSALAEAARQEGASARASVDDDNGPGVDVRVEIANLIYGNEASTSVCFASGFLDLLARETTIRPQRTPVPVEAMSVDLFGHPFAVMTGEGDFTLRDREVEYLRRYLDSGGFILASAGCSNAAWDRAFRREYARIRPDVALRRIPLEHEIFHTVFEIDHILTKRGSREVELLGIEIDGRLALVYSPQGLNDTGNAGGGCCCCGGNEIRNAKYLNANILAYALMK